MRQLWMSVLFVVGCAATSATQREPRMVESSEENSGAIAMPPHVSTVRPVAASGCSSKAPHLRGEVPIQGSG